MNTPMTDGEIAALHASYEAERARLTREIEQLRERRDQGFRTAVESGRTQAEIARITGLTRESVRRALNPEAREAAKESKRRKNVPTPG